jgi:long-subunit fatty acid transport protein
MYLSRNDRPIFNGNVAFNPWNGVLLGVGTFVTQNISGDMRLFIDENDIQIPSYATLNIKIKPTPYLSFGTNINLFEVFKISKLYFLNFSLSYKQESKYKAKFNADAALAVQLASVGLNAVLSSVPYFDPEIYTLGLSLGHVDRYLLSFDISYERWDGFEPGFIKLDGNFLNKVPLINFNNRMVYRLGGEYKFIVRKVPLFTRIGYAFVPTPVPDQKGDGNILDCDKNIYSIGLGLLVDKRKFFLESDLKIDLHYQLQNLNDRKIVKRSSSNIGYKENGYIAGGKITAMGISLSVNF